MTSEVAFESHQILFPAVLTFLLSQVYPDGKLIILAPQLRRAVVGKEDEGTKEITKTGETTTTTSEGEVDLEGGGKAKTSKQATQSKKSQVKHLIEINLLILLSCF